MSSIRLALRRLLGRRTSVPRPLVDRLEGRQLLSAGPALVGVQFFGPSVSYVSATVLTFNESLDPTTANQVNAYRLGKPNFGSGDNGVSLGDILGFLAEPKAQATKNGKIQWQSATYNDANHTVTLIPIKPFRGQAFLRVLRVVGTNQYAIKDTAGLPLNGGAGSDTVIRWVYHAGKRVHYTDVDGDIVTIVLRGPGTLYAYVRNTGDPLPIIFIDHANPQRSLLTGTVRRGPSGNGTADIGELLAAHSLTDQLLGNPLFSVQAIT